MRLMKAEEVIADQLLEMAGENEAEIENEMACRKQ